MRILIGPSAVMLWVGYLVLTSGSLCAVQQTDAPAPSSPGVSDELQQLRTEWQDAADLVEPSKGQIESLLNSIEQAEVRQSELENQRQSAAAAVDAARLKQSLQEQIDEMASEDAEVDEIPNDLDELAQRVRETKDEVERWKKLTSDAETESNRRTTRREEIRTRLLAIESELPQIETQLAAAADNNVSLAARANRLLLETQLQNRKLEAELLQSELDRYNAEEREGILQLERELYRGKLASQQARLTRLERYRNQREKQAADRTASEAEKQLAAIENINPLLTSSYEVNTQLAQQNAEAVKKSSEADAELKSLKAKLELLQRQFAETETMVEQVGLSGSVGDLLRQRKSELPNSQVSLNKARATKKKVEETQFRLFDITRRLTDLTRKTIEAEIIAANDLDKPADLSGLDSEIEKLLESRQEILDVYRKNLRAQFETAVDMEYRYRTHANLVQEYRRYLNERIFWIRSNRMLFSEWSVDESDLRLLETSRWQSSGARFLELLRLTPMVFGVLFFVVAGLIVLRPRFRAEIQAMGQAAARGSCDSFWPTLRALFATGLMAIVMPLPFVLIGFMIVQSPLNDGKSLFAALGSALYAAGLFAVPLEFLRHLCREGGLAEKHLTWSDDAVSILKRDLGWFIPLGMMITFVIALFQKFDQSHRVDLVERLFFVAGMVLLFWFLRRILSPQKGIFHVYLDAHPRSWSNQTSSLWYSAILAIPILLGLLAIWGYYYTTISLVMCAFATLVFAIVAETLRGLLMRFILVRRRHVHIETARRKREADRELRKQNALAMQQAGDSSATPHLPEPPPETDPVIDIDENALQANKLIGLGMWIVWAFGLWIIWADVLPALKALDNQPVFSGRFVDSENTQTATTQTPTPSSEATPTNGADPTNPLGITLPATDASSNQPAAEAATDLSAVTYGDVLLFLLILAITIAAARSLPSTLEMIFLNELPFDRSVRYAIKSLISYSIILVGMILAFRALSISWTNVQWLATALTFGLAFGLQEIFANFVAGIILMFERPMRIGDWITIDDFTGMVTKIRTRATTIVNLDRKEYVIPNKDFITGRLVNWTLSDAINRVEVKVGVAYGSDVEKAKQILMDACAEHPKIVDDPPSTVTFQEFGDSSLNLVLRAFLRDYELRLPVIDQLHMHINNAFKEAGIEISFPQRDLHLRSIDAKVESALRPDQSKTAEID